MFSKTDPLTRAADAAAAVVVVFLPSPPKPKTIFHSSSRRKFGNCFPFGATIGGAAAGQGAKFDKVAIRLCTGPRGSRNLQHFPFVLFLFKLANFVAFARGSEIFPCEGELIIDLRSRSVSMPLAAVASAAVRQTFMVIHFDRRQFEVLNAGQRKER